MLTLLALLLQPSVLLAPKPIDCREQPIVCAAQEAPGLKDVLRRRLETMEAQKHGVFHEDVTADVIGLFPPDQPFDETRRIIESQEMGPLTRFKGESHEGTTMYVARSRLVPETSGDVYLVIDFDFAGGSEADMRLKGVKAFLRASNM